MSLANLNNAIAELEINQMCLRKDLANMSDAQLKKLQEEIQKVRSRQDPTPSDLVNVMHQFSSRELYRIVKDAELSIKEARVVRRVAVEKRANGDSKAQQVIDLLDLRVLRT